MMKAAWKVNSHDVSVHLVLSSLVKLLLISQSNLQFLQNFSPSRAALAPIPPAAPVVTA
jgi:hypothetical protein